MLLYRGEFLSDALRNMRVTENEVRAAVRSAGLTNLESTEAVTLETDGSFNVVRLGSGIEASSLASVQGPGGSESA